MTAYLDGLPEFIERQLTLARDELSRLERARAILLSPPPRPRGRPLKVSPKPVKGGRSPRRPVAPPSPRRDGRKPLRASQPALRVIRLAPVSRPRGMQRAPRIAAVDDVLAAVTTGLDNPVAIASHLDASVVSVVGRLRDLITEGLVVHTPGGYVPHGQLPNWTEYRARELAG